MKICKNCGKEVAGEFKYCNSCGAEIEEVTDENVEIQPTENTVEQSNINEYQNVQPADTNDEYLLLISKSKTKRKRVSMNKIASQVLKKTKGKIIIICSLVLVTVILLCSIIIPTMSNGNKKFKSEEELLSYLTGVYSSDMEYTYSYFIFDKNNKLYHDFTQHDFNYYFQEYLKTTKDIESLKNMTFEDCIDNMMKNRVKSIDAEFQYKKGKIIFDDGGNQRTIDVKKDAIILTFGDSTYSMYKLSDSPVTCEEMKENFEEAKKQGFDALEFVPSFSALKKEIKTNSKTSHFVNTNWQMSAINNKEDMSTFILGNCTNTKNSSKAFLSYIDGVKGEGIMMYTSDLTVSLDDLLTIVDLYLNNVPTYPGDFAHDEIKEQMFKGKTIQNSDGTVCNSEFNLYGINFDATVIEKINGQMIYMITVYPKEIVLS